VGAVVLHIQTVGLHIDGAVGILITDHVHMALQDHRSMILHAAGTFLEKDNVVVFILNIADIMLLGKGHQIIGDLLGVAGAMGNGAEFFKIAKYVCRFQTCQLYSIHN
jgi:hypothetical protein